MEHDMRIVAGLGSVEDYEVLVKSGADELFCGFVPNYWNAAYGNLQPLNRREVFFYHVNIGSFEDMRILKKKIDAFHVPVTITLNALYYTRQQTEDILCLVEKLYGIGFEQYIIADWNLAMELQILIPGCKIHMSGEVGEWNTNTISFFQRFLHVERIIFHRKNRIEDMKRCAEISKKCGFAKEFEAFFMNELCHYTGGYCNSLHCDEMVHICQLPYELKCLNQENETILTNNETDDNSDMLETDEEIVGESGCGMCALWDLADAGIRYLKIVGRGKSAIQLAKDIQAARSAVELLNKSRTREEYLKQVKQYVFQGRCSNHCYYLQ